MLVCAFTATMAQTTYTYSLNGADDQSSPGYFSNVGKHSFNKKYAGCSYAGIDFTQGLKMESATEIDFTNTGTATVTIVQSIVTQGDRFIKFDDAILTTGRVDDADNKVGVYTITDVAPGLHKINRGSGEAGIVYISVTEAAATSPVLSMSPSNLQFKVTPVSGAQTAKFTVSGQNLTDGSYNLAVSAIDGMTVSPASFTVAGGKVDQEFTVTYSPSADAEEATTTISAVVGDLSDNIEITYSAKVTAYEKLSVSEATTWDFSKTGLTEIATADEQLNTEQLYADLGVSSSANFAAQALTFKGRYPVRNNSMAQDGVLKFTTTVPGVITVKFSDTGSAASETAAERYLRVNGVNTQYYTKRNGTNDQKTTGEIFVPAGDVTIEAALADGSHSSICVYNLTFTPKAAETKTVSLDSKGYATFASDKAFTVEGATICTLAAIPTIDGQVMNLTEQTGNVVPANTGVLLKGEANASVTLTETASATAFDQNEFVGATTAVDADGTQYCYAKDGGYFAKVQVGVSIPAGKAYFTASSGAKAFFIGMGETTGINIETIKTNSKAPMFNIAGQKIDAGYKGIVIQNGRKFISK